MSHCNFLLKRIEYISNKNRWQRCHPGCVNSGALLLSTLSLRGMNIHVLVLQGDSLQLSPKVSVQEECSLSEGDIPSRPLFQPWHLERFLRGKHSCFVNPAYLPVCCLHNIPTCRFERYLRGVTHTYTYTCWTVNSHHVEGNTCSLNTSGCYPDNNGIVV